MCGQALFSFEFNVQVNEEIERVDKVTCCELIEMHESDRFCFQLLSKRSFFHILMFSVFAQTTTL
jgi:hypothetical protein